MSWRESGREGELGESTFLSLHSFLHCQSPELSTLAGGDWRERRGGKSYFSAGGCCTESFVSAVLPMIAAAWAFFSLLHFNNWLLSRREKKKEKKKPHWSVDGRKSWSESSKMSLATR